MTVTIVETPLQARAITGGVDTHAGLLRLITAGQVIGTLQVTHRRQESHGGPADETVRSGIGGTDYQIDLSDRGRIPASIAQQGQVATGGRCRRPSAPLTRTNPPAASQRRALGKAAHARTCREGDV